METPLLPASAFTSRAAPLSSTSLIFLWPAGTFACFKQLDLRQKAPGHRSAGRAVIHTQLQADCLTRERILTKCTMCAREYVNVAWDMRIAIYTSLNVARAPTQIHFWKVPVQRVQTHVGAICAMCMGLWLIWCCIGWWSVTCVRTGRRTEELRDHSRLERVMATFRNDCVFNPLIPTCCYRDDASIYDLAC